MSFGVFKCSDPAEQSLRGHIHSRIQDDRPGARMWDRSDLTTKPRGTQNTHFDDIRLFVADLSELIS